MHEINLAVCCLLTAVTVLGEECHGAVQCAPVLAQTLLSKTAAHADKGTAISTALVHKAYKFHYH